jgi:putative oxidoreductase
MSQDLGRLLVRLGVGGMLFLHGLFKIEHGVAFIEGMVRGHGLPGFVAWAVYLGEVAAPICLVLGLWTRLAGLAIAVDMLVALALVHAHELGHLGMAGGWAVELPALYLVGGLVAALLGGGRYAVGKGRWS